jgi:cell division septum initiation protein DivIVA
MPTDPAEEGRVDIQFLVERLEGLVMHAQKVPLADKVVIERAAILDLIDQLHAAIPEEVRQARKVNQETDRVLAHARSEAEAIIAAAQEQAALLLQDQAIIRQAEDRADAMAERAQQRADETMRGADQYASDVLLRLQGDLEKTLGVVKKSIDLLEERKVATAEA